MDGRSQGGSSSSTFTSELFGYKETSTPSTGIFGSIFPPPSKVLGREAPQREDAMKGQYLSNGEKLKTVYEDGISNSGEGGNQNTPAKEVNSIYQEQRVQPCHLSSSIYYGGQDVYSHPQTTQSPGLNSIFKKEGGEDDSGSASRGNWWQGSLYY